MIKFQTIFMTVLFSLSVSLSVAAADIENTDTEKVNQYRNPITGTKTTVKKYKKKMKDEVGNSHVVSVTEKIKEKRDGTVKTTTDVHSETTYKPQ